MGTHIESLKDSNAFQKETSVLYQMLGWKLLLLTVGSIVALSDLN